MSAQIVSMVESTQIIAILRCWKNHYTPPELKVPAILFQYGIDPIRSLN